MELTLEEIDRRTNDMLEEKEGEIIMEEKIEQYLQNEYQNHIKWYKKHYYDTNYANYDNWYKEREEEYSDLVICDSCGEVVHEEDLVDNDFITEGGALKICESCRNDGYGE